MDMAGTAGITIPPPASVSFLFLSFSSSTLVVVVSPLFVCDYLVDAACSLYSTNPRPLYFFPAMLSWPPPVAHPPSLRETVELQKRHVATAKRHEKNHHWPPGRARRPIKIKYNHTALNLGFSAVNAIGNGMRESRQNEMIYQERAELGAAREREAEMAARIRQLEMMQMQQGGGGGGQQQQPQIIIAQPPMVQAAPASQ
jgi:hypothetical protein